jgi:hypothetical protein
MNNETIQRGFGVQPTSFRLSKSASVSLLSTSLHHKRLRRLSTGKNEYLMMNDKSRPIIISDDDENDVILTTKNEPLPIKRPLQENTGTLNLDDFIDVDKPVRKQNRRMAPNNDTRMNVSSTAAGDDDDDEVTVVSSSSNGSGGSCDNNSGGSSIRSSCSEPSLQKRTVRFPIDIHGNVQTQEYYLSEKEAEMFRQCPKKVLWWTKKDRLASRDAARERIQIIPQLFPAYQAATIQLLTKFGGIDTSGDILLPPKLLSWYDEQPRSDSFAVQVIARTSDTSRGMEKMLYRVIGIPPLKYRNSVKHVIASQNEMKVSGCCTPDLIMDVLATQYIQDTYGAVAMARLIAESDVIAAQRSDSAMLHI